MIDFSKRNWVRFAKYAAPADDFAMGKLIARAGWRVALSSYACETVIEIVETMAEAARVDAILEASVLDLFTGHSARCARVGWQPLIKRGSEGSI